MLTAQANVALDIATGHVVVGKVLGAHNHTGGCNAHRDFVFQAHEPNLRLAD